MKKLIITGAGGFIGSHCIEALKEKNYQIYAISRSVRADSNTVKWIQADLFNFNEINSAIKKIGGEILLHLAWVTIPGIFYESEDNLKWVDASLNLFKSFLSNGGKRLVMGGSCAEYDWNKKELLEDDESSPLSLYGKAKLLVLDEIKKTCLKNNASFAWGRIFNVYGPKEPSEKIISLIIISAITKTKIQCPAKDNIRDFIYVKDVANILVALLENSFNGVINIATGIGHSIGEITKLIERKLNVSNICEFKQSNSELPMVIGNTKKLNSLGLSHMFDLSSGLDEMIRWYQHEFGI